MNKKLLIVVFAVVLIFSMSAFSALPTSAVSRPNGVIDISSGISLVPSTPVSPDTAEITAIKTLFSKYYNEYMTGEASVGITKCQDRLGLALKFETQIENNKNSLDPNLVRGTIAQESTFNPLAINPKDPSYGIMQVGKANLIGTGYPALKWPNVFDNEQWQDPNKNIDRGTTLYNYYYNTVLGKCDDKAVFDFDGLKVNWRTILSIGSYNSGPGVYDTITDNDKIEAEECALDSAKIPNKDHIAKVLAWHKIFNDNYDAYKNAADKSAYKCVNKKPTVPPVNPPPAQIVSCESCNSFESCLACMDKKFIVGTFKAE